MLPLKQLLKYIVLYTHSNSRQKLARGDELVCELVPDQPVVRSLASLLGGGGGDEHLDAAQDQERLGAATDLLGRQRQVVHGCPGRSRHVQVQVDDCLGERVVWRAAGHDEATAVLAGGENATGGTPEGLYTHKDQHD